MTYSTNPLFDGNLVITIGGIDVTAVLLPGLSWSTTAPGGFGEATMRLPATAPWAPYGGVTGAVSAAATVQVVATGAIDIVEA